MTFRSYGFTVIPDADKLAFNRLAALYYGDGQPPASENLSQPLIPADAPDPATAPATHWFGGLTVNGAWLSAFVPADAPMPAPLGGWPLMAGEVELLDEASAAAAWAARKVYTAGREDEVENLAASCEAAALADLGLARPPPPAV